MTPGQRHEQTAEIIKFIVAHDVLVWAGVIMAIIGLVFIFTRNAYEMLNIEDGVRTLICALALTGAFFGRHPLQVHGITDGGTIALTAEILALLLAALLVRVQLEHD